MLFGYSILFLPFAVLSLSRGAFFSEHLENLPALKVGVLYGEFVLLAICFGFFIHRRERTGTIFNSRVAQHSYFLFLSLLAFTPPLLSWDSAFYLVAAKNWVEFGANPHLTPIGAVPANPWLQELGPNPWLLEPSLYGPLFTIVTAPFALLPLPLIGAVLLWKFGLTALFLLSIALVDAIVRERPERHGLVALYALNPALLINFILEGHSDLFVLVALLGFVLAIKRGWFLRAATALGIAIALKYIAVILTGALLLEKRISVRMLPGILVALVLPGILALACFEFPLQQIRASFDFLRALDCFYSCTPTISGMKSLFGEEGARSIAPIATFGMIGALTITFFFRKIALEGFVAWSLLALLFFGTFWLTPWYLTLVIPFLLLNRQELVYLLITVYSLLHYFSV